MKKRLVCLVGLALISGSHAALAGGSWSSQGGSHGGSHGGAHVAVGVHARPVGAHAHSHPVFVHSHPAYRSRVVVVAGGPLYPYYSYYPYYYPPAYYPPAPMYADPAYSQPQQYIEQQPAAPAAPQVSYYCPDSRDYYPNVQTCASPWMKVLP